MNLPVVDLEASDAGFAFDDAMRKRGFCVLTNHGLSLELSSKLISTSLQFFAQSQTQKLKYNNGPYGNRDGGYQRVGAESVSGSSSVDPVESFVFPCRIFGAYDDDPGIMGEFAINARAYAESCVALRRKVHALASVALGKPVEYLDSFYDQDADDFLRLSYYPLISSNSGSVVRYGAHTDYQGFTFLLRPDEDESSSNLQVFENDEWIDVAHLPKSVVCNAGDLMRFWSNERWTSATHRVVSTVTPCGSRLSVPFFTGPTPWKIISPIVRDGEDAVGGPTRADAFLDAKVNASRR